MEEYITLVLHTPKRAHELSRILEQHGIPVQMVAVSEKPLAYSLQIARSDLRLALKILESTEPYSPAQVSLKLAGMSENLLIPVDFTDYSMLAVKVGLDLARRLKLHPLLLHTYSAYPSRSDKIPAIADPKRIAAISQREAEKEFIKFVREVRRLRKEGEFADVRFSTMLREGLPEEVIADYCRLTPPALIVMATRERSKKEAQIIGSVTAEVIDSCRVPVFTVPESYKFPGIAEIKKIGAFAVLDRQDIRTMDSFMRMFEFPVVDITIFPVQFKTDDVEDKLKSEKAYYKESYPTASFDYRVFSPKNFFAEMEAHFESNPMELFVIPNKKANVFSRLFKPGIAHRMLFERDVPMLVIPVE